MSNSSENIPLVKALPLSHVFLRRATSRLHQRIDQGSVLTVLTIPTGVTLDLYRAAMLSLKRAYEEIDALLVQACAWCPADLPPFIPRVPFINRDLNALGVIPGLIAGLIPNDLCPASGHSALDSEAAYLGVRYVVEGAQLGSRVIYGHLHKAFGGELSEFGTFWTPGSIMQGSWPQLLKILGRMESRDSLAAAARAARTTFRLMAAHLAVLEMRSL
jgi:heme oxygenase